MKGLLIPVAKFCEQKVGDPFNLAARTTFVTLPGVKKLLKWAEQCLYEDQKVLSNDQKDRTMEVVPITSVMRRNGGARAHGDNEAKSRHTDQVIPMSAFEKTVLEKLSKLDVMENDLALMKDRVD